MAENRLILAAREGDASAVRELLSSGADVSASDSNGWTALCWAAARGHLDVARELVEHGSDVYQTGTDQRTPYLIALAASNLPLARFLEEAENRAGGDADGRSSGQAKHRPYCKAYILSDLRRFCGWTEDGADPLPAETVVFLHTDLSVTRAVWLGEDVVFAGSGDGWRVFCQEQLQFQAPSDYNWIPDLQE
jgi:hypothetical protein